MKRLFYFFFGFYFCFSFGMEEISQKKQEAMSHLPGAPLDYSKHFSSVMLSKLNYSYLGNSYLDQAQTSVALWLKQHPYHPPQAFLINENKKEIFYLQLNTQNSSDLDIMEEVNQIFNQVIKNTLINNSSNGWGHKIILDNVVSCQRINILKENEFIVFNINKIKFIPIKYTPVTENGDHVNLFLKPSYGRFWKLDENGKIDGSGHCTYVIGKVPKIILQVFKKNKYGTININDDNNTVQLNLTIPQIQFLLHNKQRYPKITISHNNEHYDIIQIIDLSSIKKDINQHYVENSLGHCDLEFKKKENRKNLKILAKKNNPCSNNVSQSADKPVEDFTPATLQAQFSNNPEEISNPNSLHEAPVESKIEFEAHEKIEHAIVNPTEQNPTRKDSISETLEDQLSNHPQEVATTNLLHKESDTLKAKLETNKNIDHEKLPPTNPNATGEDISSNKFIIPIENYLNDPSEHAQPTNKKSFLAFTIAGITIASLIILFRNDLLTFLFQLSDKGSSWLILYLT